jgi:hypothetical protein
LAARRDCDHRRVTAAVVIGLLLAGLCGAALNRIAGPVVDSVGMLLAAVLYGTIGFVPHVE